MKTLVASALIALAAPVALAAQSAPPAAPFVKVDAPNAQRLVMEAMRRHPEIHLLGLHANVPGGTDNVIVACSDPARIGKPSSVGDMALIGKPKIMVANLPEKHVYEVAMALSDREGRSVGMMIDQMDPAKIKDEPDALRRGLALRSELQAAILDEGWIFAGR